MPAPASGHMERWRVPVREMERKGMAQESPGRILVYEFFSAGEVTVAGEPPAAGEVLAAPDNLATEGLLMLQAVIQDLVAIPGVKVVTVLNRYYRSLKPEEIGLDPAAIQVIWSEPGGKAGGLREEKPSWPSFRQGLQAADAALIIAPETAGILAQLTGLAEAAGKVVLGSSARAVAVAADKQATLARLRAAGIAVPEGRACDLGGSTGWQDWCREFPGAEVAVVKPVDGAGSQDTFLVHDQAGLDRALKRLARAWPDDRFLIQEYIPGEAASVSCLVAPEQVLVLSLNQQLISVQEGAFSFQGVKVPYHHPWAEQALAVARRCCRAVPGLAGWVGVDLVLGPQGPVVMEVNPRVTDAYVALRRVTGANLGQYLLAACTHRCLPPPPQLEGEFTLVVGGHKD